MCVLIASQAVSAYFIYRNYQYMKNDPQVTMAQAIRSAEETRYSYPIIDVSENRVYIPEARIYLPLNQTTRNLRYEYNDSFNKPNLYLSMRGVVGYQRADEPATCDKMLTFLKDPTDSMNFVSEIEPTKDGFRYIYAHSKCNSYYGTISEDLTEAVKQVKNY